MKKLPIGIQNIREILQEGYVYVDKTLYAKQLIENGKHYFLSRPRRFGKSLFLDTLLEIFRGNKELFKDCLIYNSDYLWDIYPVIYIDFSEIVNSSTEAFEKDLKSSLEERVQEQGLSISAPTLEKTLKFFVTTLAKENSVVVLIDEYDKPIIDNLHDLKIAEANKSILKRLFTMLKSLDKHLKFTFTTGVSKFSQTSLFSGANHLEDITMDGTYATMMGYREEEIAHFFEEHITGICEKKDPKRSKEEIFKDLRHWYNGYCFSEEKQRVYNPLSTLCFLKYQKTGNYWFSTGTPSFLINEVRKHPKGVLPLRGIRILSSHLSDITNLHRMRLPALMFQSGYLTIRDYDAKQNAYTLDFPNEEVRSSFFDSLLDEFSGMDPLKVLEEAPNLRSSLESLDLQTFFTIMKGHFASIPYHLFPKAPLSQENRVSEGFYHAVFFILMEKSALYAQAEVATNQGRIDLVCELDQMMCLFEFKLEVSADAALLQVQEKKYLEKYLNKGKQILILGVNFSSSARNIETWSALLFSESGNLIKDLS